MKNVISLKKKNKTGVAKVIDSVESYFIHIFNCIIRVRLREDNDTYGKKGIRNSVAIFFGAEQAQN